MKRVLLAAATVACLGTVALAGPNAGGTLIIVSDGVIYCGDNAANCGLNSAADCADTNGRIDGANLQAIVLNVLAAFSPSASPRLAGITFGLAYNGAEIFVTGVGGCGDFELADDTWPASGSGTAVTWTAAQTGQLNDVYWIAAYNYYGNPNTVDLVPHPSQGANFADDSIPAEIDPIAGLGSFGFDDDGNIPCPDPNTPGACCAPDGSCTVVMEEDCADDFLGSDTSCSPNPCDVGGGIGACCTNDQICSIRTEAECADAGGEYLGNDIPCDPNPCPDPDTPGACCAPDGGCIVVMEADCMYTFLGSDTSCSPNPCGGEDGTGACCNTDLTCSIRTEAECADAGGAYLGDDVPCDPFPCVSPVTRSTWGRIKSEFR